MPYMKDTAPAFGKQIKGNTVNMQFAVLSALGMFFVVDGHLNNSYLDIGGLFPYYSFHMPLFAFISGYFFRPGSEDDLGAYAKKKAVRLLGPYMAYNLIYGIITQFLHGAGFAFGGSLNLHNLLIEPFITDTSLNITWLPGLSRPCFWWRWLMCCCGVSLGRRQIMNMR